MSDEMQHSDQQPATKADLNTTNANLNSLKSDFRSFADELRADFRAFTVEMRDLLRPIQINVARHTGELADIREELKGVRTNMVTRDEFHSRMDGFAGLAEDSRRRWATHADVLTKHDERLKKLEPPTA